MGTTTAEATETTIVRLWGHEDAPRHYAVPTEEQYHYKLLCNGQVIDALAYGSPLAAVTCPACQAMDKPLDVETACYRVARALGYRGNGGGWIYGPNATAKSRAIAQGWGGFATVMWSRFSGRGLIARKDGGWVVNRAAVAAAVEAQAERRAA